MRYFLLGLLLFTLGCTAPSEKSIYAISGHYYLRANADGSVHTNFGDVPFHEAIDWDLTITAAGVMEHNRKIDWTYDGTTLTLHDTDSEPDNDPRCGSLQMEGVLTLVVPIKKKQDSGTVSGKVSVTVKSQNCGTVSGDVALSGNFSKA